MIFREIEEAAPEWCPNCGNELSYGDGVDEPPAYCTKCSTAWNPDDFDDPPLAQQLRPFISG